MEITYDRIAEVNKQIVYTNIKGKPYAEVAQRVQAFRKLIPGGFITTEILKLEGGVVYMKADAGFYGPEGKVTLATGYAFERQDASNINKTSFIENCETSAIGRALGFIGLGSEYTLASKEELTHAIETQNAIETGMIPDPVKQFTPPQAAQAEVTKAATVPEIPKPDKPKKPEPTPAQVYLLKAMKELRAERGISVKENNTLFTAQFNALKENGIVPDKPLDAYTLDEAEALIDAMYKRFSPTGTEIKK